MQRPTSCWGPRGRGAELLLSSFGVTVCKGLIDLSCAELRSDLQVPDGSLGVVFLVINISLSCWWQMALPRSLS